MNLDEIYYFHAPTKLVIGCGALSKVVEEAQGVSMQYR
jgi:hypothetical protein